MSGRVSQEAVEGLIIETVYPRVGQIVVEALINQPTASPTTPTGAGITQVAVEALIATSEAVKVTGIAVEALIVDGEVTTGGPGGGGGTRVYGWAG